jgi:hypothetical protein
MKKFFTLVAAGSIALSLTAVTLAAETNVSADATVSASVSSGGKVVIDCSKLSGITKSRCLAMLAHTDKKMVKMENKMQKVEQKAAQKIERISARSLRAQARIDKKMHNDDRLQKYMNMWTKSSSSKSSMSSSSLSSSSKSSSSMSSSSWSSSSVSSVSSSSSSH